MSQKIAKLLFPFSVLSENRSEQFSNEMEKAAIYCLAELERSKGGGLILKKPPEKLVFLVELGYPFWLGNWNGLTLILDGLKTKAHTVVYKPVQDVKAFIDNVQRSSKTLEAYTAFLSDKINYFQMPSEEKTLAIDALITEPNFLSELASILSKSEKFEAPLSNLIFLPPAMDEPAASSAIEELEDLKLEFEKDVEILYGSMKLLNKTTRNFAKTIRAKIKAVKEEFDVKIKEQEGIVAPKVTRINEEYDEQITGLMKNFEKQLLPLQKEKVKFEKARDQAKVKIERCKIEARTAAASGDAVGERKWMENANETKKELSENETKIEEIEKRIKDANESKSLETFRLRSEWEAKAKDAQKDLLELEASRDASIQIHKEEIGKLESLTSTIIQQIDKMAKMREADIANFEKLGVRQKHENFGLFYMPFYLACYQAESKKRYVVFPPSSVNSVGFSTRIKGALGRTKVKQLLTQRFKTIGSFLNMLPSMVERNAVFEREINESGAEDDILKADVARESVRNGLKRLKEEGWFSEKEYATFNQAIA